MKALLATLAFATGCAVNAASGGPVPVRGHGTPVYVAPGAHLVPGLTEPVFMADGRYWLWEHGRWHAWRDVGWQPTPPPPALADLDATLAIHPIFLLEP
jgi:hypothetical protein